MTEAEQSTRRAEAGGGGPLRIGVQMDAPLGLRLAGDSTFALAAEAARRGHALLHWAPQDLSLCGFAPRALAAPLLATEGPDRLASGQAQETELASLDAVLMRQDPPFNAAYLSAAWLLSYLPAATPVFNDPQTVISAPEKLLQGLLARRAPPTLISWREDEIRTFARAAGAEEDGAGLVAKPLFSHGGRGVERLAPGLKALSALLARWATEWEGPPLFQPYLPEVARLGDRRVLVVAGKAVAAIRRLPKAGEFRANLGQGGRAEAAQPAAHEREAAAELGETLGREAILLAGLDFIGERLIEVNVTSPTGLREAEALTGAKVAALFWDEAERIVARRRAGSGAGGGKGGGGLR